MGLIYLEISSFLKKFGFLNSFLSMVLIMVKGVFRIKTACSFLVTCRLASIQVIGLVECLKSPRMPPTIKVAITSKIIMENPI